MTPGEPTPRRTDELDEAALASRQLRVGVLMGAGLGLALAGMGAAIGEAGAVSGGLIAGFTATPVKLVEGLGARRLRAARWTPRRAAWSVFATALVGIAVALVHAVAVPGLAGPHAALAAALPQLSLAATEGLLGAIAAVPLVGAAVYLVGALPRRRRAEVVSWGGVPFPPGSEGGGPDAVRDVERVMLCLVALVFLTGAAIATATFAPGLFYAAVVLPVVVTVQWSALVVGFVALVLAEELSRRFVDGWCSNR